MPNLRILHLSDIHFGSEHRFQPQDKTHPKAGYPGLFESLSKDLTDPAFNDPAWHPKLFGVQSPLIVAITGDLTQKADRSEFDAAMAFIKQFNGTSVLGWPATLKDVFLVPGNHDVNYTVSNDTDRVTPFTNFYGELFDSVRPSIPAFKGKSLTQVHDKADAGFIVVEINTALYVQRGTDEEHRGAVDAQVIAELDEHLTNLSSSRKFSAIRVAMLHHHPVLLPELVEVGRDYDAVAGAKHLLKLLRKHGFHLVLHGHKHFPNMFSYDSDPVWTESESPAMVVYGGGSAGSRGLPDGRKRNTYALFSLSWDQPSGLARIRAITRGLVCEADDGEMLPHLWKWETLRDSDRVLSHPRQLPRTASFPKAAPWTDGEHEAKRRREYERLHGNMAVCAVQPSLIPGQTYEVRCWIVPHAGLDGRPKPGWIAPVSVTWSAGPNFPTVTIERRNDAAMSCNFGFWAPVLIQAELRFPDGSVERTHTYAHMPGLDIKTGSPPE